MTHLAVGDAAPSFLGKNELGIPVSLEDFKGKKWVLFFYPKNNTPGCTAQVCNLRDNQLTLKAQGYQLLGISPDTEQSHLKFKEKHHLPFPLIADTDTTIAKAYGVWGPKKFMGKEYDGIHRTTFIINENGIIEQIILKVATKTHAQQLLK